MTKRNQPQRRVTDGARTRDVQDHNLALYQLSYSHQHARRRAVELPAKY